MGRTRSVLLIVMLLAGSLSPPAIAQQELRTSPPLERERTFELEQNYPTPVSSETFIPFTLNSNLFEARDSAVVSLRIYNMLRQLVAIPIAVDESAGGRRPIINLAYRSPGRKIAHWNGKNAAGQPLPSGIYYCQLEVRGEPAPQTRQIIVLTKEKRRTIIPWFGRDE